MTSLLERLPAREREIMRIASEIARQQGSSVYLVGGPVRDLLLGRNPADLDFTLENNTEKFAHELARRTESSIREYPQFLTYKIEVNGLSPIDVTTTRKETYPQPGALPVVMASDLRDDLQRRDFAMNAIALELTSEAIHDPYGGHHDVRERVVRILHDRSFEDDPTRIFRSLRLASRLGFALQPNTEGLMRKAIEGGFAKTVSAERLWREFFLAVGESDRAAVLHAFSRAGALKVFGCSGSELEVLRRANQLLAEIPGDARVTFLILLCSQADEEFLARSGLTGRQIATVRDAASARGRLAALLRDPASERDKIRIAAAAPREQVLAAAAVNPELTPLLRRVVEYQNAAPPVRGDELEVPPGPHIGLALERTREALFFGDITPDQALLFARRAALEYLEKKSR
jgi:tRNA nucleotidyltransferase/poly(A) polymerase